MHELTEVDAWLIDSLVVPASLHDVEGTFVYVNEAAERASGRSNAHWHGRHFSDPLPPAARKQVAALFRRAVERGEPTEFETVFVDAAGELRGVRAQHLPLRSGGEIVGVLILAFEARSSEDMVLKHQPRLTARQREVLDLVASGLSTSEIAAKLTVSAATIRNHLRSVFRELRVHTRLEAIAAARRLGLLAPPVLGPPLADRPSVSSQ